MVDYYNQGVISSPGFSSGSYCGPLSCVYRLNANFGQRVSLNVVSFNTEQNIDTLTLYDGVKGDNVEAIIGTLSGSNAPTNTFYSGSQSLTLVFKTDLGGNTGGWRIQWGSTNDNGCGRLVSSGSSFTFNTPNYPFNYYNNADCTWNFTATNGTLAKVSFSQDADTELGSDTVVVRGGNPTSYSGTASSSAGNFAPVLSNSNQISVEFRSDSSVAYRGFSATFSGFTPPPACNCGPQEYVLNDATQTLTVTSPNFGNGHNGYCINAHCLWYIQVPSTYKAQITFQSFNMETGYDFLIIDDDVNGKQLEKCTGLNTCQTATSSTYHMTLLFTTDGSVSKDGFSATVSAVSA